MAAPTITRHPRSQTVVAGRTVRLTVEADGATEYAWSRNGQPIHGATGSSYELVATHDISRSRFTVTAKNAAGEQRISDEATITVVEEVPPLYDPAFTVKAGLALAAAFLLVLWPIWVIAGRAAFAASASFPAVIAVQLVIVGVLVALAGVFLALLDFRGRARTLAELQRPPAGAPRAQQLGAVEEVAKSLPQVLREFGELRAPAAAMALAALLFVLATVIAWRGLPADTDTTSTTTTVAARAS